MLFNSFQFALFFALVLLLHRTLPRRLRNGLLLAASLVFYSLWVPSYLFLLLADIGVNYALIRTIARGRHRRLALGTSAVVILGLLAGFKYAALAIETIAPALRAGFGFDPPIPEIFLPLGISFFSFQMLGLAIDVYRGDIEAPESLSRYALFVSFFPQLIAGPILRGSEFLPQLTRGAAPNAERTQRGLWLIACGLAKKVILADYLLAPFVDDVFRVPGIGSPAFHWIAAFSFAFQIYYDFSGYTDMARGIALLLGFEIPVNFLEPYLSRDPAEFWRRWHITLSSWLRDYLYIPLGGNRRGESRTLVNLLLTMLLGGLWHGAAWNFVIWGGLHGVLLMIHREFGRSRDADREIGLRDVPRIGATFVLVSVAWVFFRAPSFEEANLFLLGMVGAGTGTGWPLFQTGVVTLCGALHVLERVLRVRGAAIRAALSQPFWGPIVQAAGLGLVVGLAIAVGGAGGEFIYFQF
jgi:D-alanyl-lipoteichoic acid acyltransferase DltB (MBOAT superfamily)